MELENKTVVITGGAAGIGRATARRCGEEGADVVVADIDEDSGKDVVESLRDDGVEATFYHLDVTDSDRFHAVVDDVVERHGLDVLVNNAGTAHPSSYVEETDDAMRDYVLEVNIEGVWNGCHAALPYMKAQESGAIVNVGSLASIRGLPRQAAYSLSKGAVLNFTRAVAAEAGPDGVRANTVCPGFTETRMLDQYLAMQEDPAAAREALRKEYPLKRLGKPGEIADAIVFLASERASWITGHGLVIDGGYSVS